MMETKEMRIQIEGMGCKSCVAKIEKAVSSVEGAEGKVDFETKTARIQLSSDSRAEENVVNSIRRLGYTVNII